MSKQSRKAPKSGTAGQLRIIAGDWRGRKLGFPALEGLRPTPDRVRETLFNWLAPVVPGSHCLDLFAGSGALGLEALSRGAARVSFVEQAAAAAQQLRDNLALLNCAGGEVWQGAAEQFLPQAAGPYELVFLDPPFRQGMLADCLALLQRPGLLASRAWVYIETGRDEALPPLPANWCLHREKTAGQVCYRLFQIGC